MTMGNKKDTTTAEKVAAAILHCRGSKSCTGCPYSEDKTCHGAELVAAAEIERLLNTVAHLRESLNSCSKADCEKCLFCQLTDEGPFCRVRAGDAWDA